MHLDLQGLPVSTDVALAARRYADGQAMMLAAWPGAIAAFDEAITADPEFALPYASRARQYAMRGQAAQAEDSLRRAKELTHRRGDERERSHVEVLMLAVTGQSAAALERALSHAESWPRDALVLSLPLGAFGLFAFSGMADHDQARVDLCARHARHFSPDDWWFETAHGWALAENGAVSRGRAMLEQALEVRRENASNVHALAHAMYEGGAWDEAEALIAGWLPGYDRSGVLHGHLAWHSALTALERGDAAGALEIYGEHVHLSVSGGMPINLVSDAASLLWRLRLDSHDTPPGAWREVADYARQAFPQPGHAFVDAHMALIEAATGDRAAFQDRMAQLDQMVASGRLAAGIVVPTIGRAALAFAEGDYRACANLLEPMAAEVARIGGSRAQRDMLEDTLLVALMRCGEAAKAATLLDRRLHRRPSRRDTRWREALAIRT
jgi:tetratricopeptide (TPR) repeat protein